MINIIALLIKINLLKFPYLKDMRTKFSFDEYKTLIECAKMGLLIFPDCSLVHWEDILNPDNEQRAHDLYRIDLSTRAIELINLFDRAEETVPHTEVPLDLRFDRRQCPTKAFDALREQAGFRAK